jgi:soluble lytic murein transglycosylase-like protein
MPSLPGEAGRIARALLAVSLSMPMFVFGQVYSGADASGTIVLSNHASPEASQMLIAPEPPASTTALPSAVAPGGTSAPRPRPAPHALQGSIRDAAQRHAVPESLLTAVVAVESGFDPRARSPKGAMGLMQLMPDTARRFGVRNAYAVDENLRGGAAYLRWLMDLFPDDLTLALAAYNAGEGAVERAGRRVPPYQETQAYVRKVLAHAATSTQLHPARER